MDFDLTAAQQDFYKEIVNFATTQLHWGGVPSESDRAFSRDAWWECGIHRLQGLPVPESQGGRGLDPLSTVVALEALGYGSPDSGLVFSVGAHLATATIPLWKFGTTG